MRASYPAIALCFAIAACAGAAVAGEPSAAEEDKRTRIFESASEDYAKGRWAEAAAKLERVVELRRTSQALRALALVEKELGRLVSAKAHAAEALSLAKGQSEEEPACKQALEVIAPLVPKVAVHLPGGMSAARIRVDGAPVSAAGGVLEVDPGKHSLRVEAPDHEPFEEVIEVAAGSTTGVDVVLRPAASKSVEPPGSRVPWIAGGVSLLALGAAGVAVGAYGAAQSAAVDNILSRACSGQYCPPGYDQYVKEYNISYSLSVAGFVAAGVGLLGGGALLVLSPSAPEKRDRTTSRIGLFAGPSSLGVTGTF